MFDIEYKGGNAVVFTTKKGKLVVDPNISVVGLKNLVVKDAVQVATESRFGVEGKDSRLNIEGPGEYEVGDFAIIGVSSERYIDGDTGKKDCTMYRVDVGDIRVGVIGNISPKLTEDQYESLGLVDVVVIPVGGNGYTLDAVQASAVVRQMEPKLVIPVHYSDSGLKYEVPQDSLDVFIKELAAPVEDSVDKLKIKGLSSLPQVMTVSPLNRS